MRGLSFRVPGGLSIEGLHVALGGNAILRGISLRVRGGEVLGVLGPSGAGKSTLFRSLAGEIAVTRGTIRLGDRDISNLPLWRRARIGLGYQPQTPSVLFDLTVRQNLRTFVRAARVSPHKTEERAERLGLNDRLSVRARDLSGGERRRLEVVRALTTEPSVLLCDEPFAGVDPKQVSAVVRVIREHAEAGAAVIVADHRVADALMLCDRAALMVEGHIAVTLEASDFAEHPAVKERYLG